MKQTAPRLHQLLQLLSDNAQAMADQAPAIHLETADGQAPRLYVYGPIDSWYGASTDALVEAFAALGGADVHVHINSPGGDVFEARAMAAQVVAYAGRVDMHIDGLAASAATYFALSGNSCSITDGGMLMVHEGWTLAMGNKGELRKTADLLDKVDATIVADYIKRTGKPEAEVRAWVEAETWFSAEEALALGFVDSIDANTKHDKAQASASRWNLSAYANAPKLAPPAAIVDAHITNQLQANRNRVRMLATF
jgi:ATP-dependent Clp protease protease subunit